MPRRLQLHHQQPFLQRPRTPQVPQVEHHRTQQYRHRIRAHRTRLPRRCLHALQQPDRALQPEGRRIAPAHRRRDWKEDKPAPAADRHRHHDVQDKRIRRQARVGKKEGRTPVLLRQRTLHEAPLLPQSHHDRLRTTRARRRTDTLFYILHSQPDGHRREHPPHEDRD